MFENYNGVVTINEKELTSDFDFKSLTGLVQIKLRPNVDNNQNESNTKPQSNPVVEAKDTTEYKIKVQQYMTKPSSPGFDFMEKWNNNNPMPMRVMVGTEIQETKGMVKMRLRGQGLATVTCMRCGRALTNPISRHYGIGPECMSKLGLTADIDDVSTIKEQLVNIEWTGWIIKRAIESKEVYNGED